MCGEIKHHLWSNKEPIVPGDFLPHQAEVFVQKGRSLEADTIPGHLVRWNGFAREETLGEKFPRRQWKRAEIVINSFSEKNNDYSLPEGYTVQAVITKTQNFYQANLITRPATGKEIEVSERWLKTCKRRYAHTPVTSGGGSTGQRMVDSETVVKVAITGHRPKRILGKEDTYNWKHPKAVKVRRWLVTKMLKLKEQAEKENKQLIAACGMALGVDLWFAAVCVKLNIPFVAFVPCTNQDKLWSKEYQEMYKKACAKASKVYYASNEDYKEAQCMLDRNDSMRLWLLEKEDSVLLSVWDECKTGGTWHMVNQCKKSMIKTENLNPESL